MDKEHQGHPGPTEPTESDSPPTKDQEINTWNSNHSKSDELRVILKDGNVILVSAEGLVPPSGLGVVKAIGDHFLVLDPLPHEDKELSEEYNLNGVLFRTIVPLDTIKLIVKIREEPAEPQITNNDTDGDNE